MCKTQLVQTSETGIRQAGVQYVATCDQVPLTNHKQYVNYLHDLLTTISKTKHYNMQILAMQNSQNVDGVKVCNLLQNQSETLACI